PSLWQQGIKRGETTKFDDWLADILGQGKKGSIPDTMRQQLDQGCIVSYWAEIVGPENVTVIISDKSNKKLLTNAFERLLGLPEDMLTNAALNSTQANRSMSLLEAEAFRRLNIKLN